MIRISIGRNEGNKIVIPIKTVSGTHADVYVYDNGEMQLVDHSLNGTFVNGQKLHNSTMPLKGGEVLNFAGQCERTLSQILSEAGIHVPTTYVSGHGISQSPSNGEPVNGDGNSGKIRSSVGFGEALSLYFNHYVDFTGRARRSEYWFVVLWNLIFGIIPFVNILWLIATIIPSLALAVRRLHDTNKSGWCLLFSLIPFFGPIVLLVFYFTDSDKGTNSFGPSPKYM